VLLAAAVLIVMSGLHHHQLSPVGWVAGLTLTQLILGGGLVLLAAICTIQGWFLLAILRQNGRILKRLEAWRATARLRVAVNPRCPTPWTGC
jgi:hypothetical protein